MANKTLAQNIQDLSGRVGGAVSNFVNTATRSLGAIGHDVASNPNKYNIFNQAFTGKLTDINMPSGRNLNELPSFAFNELTKSPTKYSIFNQASEGNLTRNTPLEFLNPVEKFAGEFGKNKIQAPAYHALRGLYDTFEPNKDKTLTDRAVSLGGAGLNALMLTPGGLAYNSTIDPLIRTGFQSVKQSRTGKFDGQSLADSASGKQFTGLGDAVTDNPLLATVGNFAELPLMIFGPGGTKMALNKLKGNNKTPVVNNIAEIKANVSPELKKQADTLIKDYIENTLKPSGKQGVMPGGLIKDAEGVVTGRYGRQSMNPSWYRDAFKAKGGRLSYADYKKIAIDHLVNGNAETGVTPNAEFLDLVKQVKQVATKVPEQVVAAPSGPVNRTTFIPKEPTYSPANNLKNAGDFLENSDKWKNKATPLLSRETFIRNIEDITGKDAPKIKELFVEPIGRSEAARIRFMDSERAAIKNLGIKAGSNDSALLQQFGEKKISEPQLRAMSPIADKIIAADKYIRGKYDQYLLDINRVLLKNGYDPIPKRKDYYTHFQEVNNVLEKFGVPVLDNVLPTNISGITSDFKPRKNFFSQALPRMGDKTKFDAIGGIDRYLESASKQIFHTDNINRLRKLDEALRQKYAGSTHLNTFVANLTEYTNQLAGKKAMVDRAAEDVVGRRVYGVVDRLRKQFGANAVGANISSALTNFIPLTQSAATTRKDAFLKGLAEAGRSAVHDDGFVAKSDFLTRRFGSAKLDMSAWDKAADKASILFKAVDRFVAESIVRGKYHEGLSQGLKADAALARADDWAARIMADRSIGGQPNLFGSKTLGLITQFQLEVNNQMSFLAKDIPRNYGKLGTANALAQVTLYSFLFNNIYEKVAGRRPAIDPIGVALKSYEDFNNPDISKGQATLNTVNRVSDSLPFTSILTGGRIPLEGGLPNPMDTIKAVAEGDTKTIKKELSKPAFYLLPPFGGGQVKKTLEGMNAFNQGASTSDTGRVRFPIPQTTENQVKTALFGQWSTPEADKYIREGFKTLGDKQSQYVLNADNVEGTFNEVKAFRNQDDQRAAFEKDSENAGTSKSGNTFMYFANGKVNEFDTTPVDTSDTSIGGLESQEQALTDAVYLLKNSQVFKKDSKITTQQVQSLLKEKGMNYNEVAYKAIRGLTEGSRAKYTSTILNQTKDTQSAVRSLVENEILTSGVVDSMVEQRLMSPADATVLKKVIKNVKSARLGYAPKAKKATIPKIKVDFQIKQSKPVKLGSKYKLTALKLRKSTTPKLRA